MDDLKKSENLSNSSGWGKCPADILMIIFLECDPKTLANCMAVNAWWRYVVDYTGQHHKLWPRIAQAAIVNQGVTLRRKTKLNWRDLYFNYILWENVEAAEGSWSHVLCLQDIKYIHVYKDVLIVEYGPQLFRKYFKIVEPVRDPEVKKGCTEGPLARAVRNEASSLNGSPMHPVKGHGCEESDRMIAKLRKENPFKRLIVMDDNAYYVLDDRNVLRYFKWDDVNNIWIDHTLARYYGCKSSISDIHVCQKDVYLLLKGGNIMRLDREGRNFETAFRFDYPQFRAMQYARLLHYDLLSKKIEKVFSLDLPEYSTGRRIMFNEFSAVVSVPSDREFKINYNGIHMVLEYPDLTCATQHGDILFLGFQNGKIEICLPKRFLENGGKPEVCTNVQECTEFCDEDPAIVALEAYEARYSHHLFVATSSNIYRLVFSYPEELQLCLGITNTGYTDF